MDNATRKVPHHKPPASRSTPEGGSDWHTLRAGQLQILQARVLAGFPWLVHGFSTRPGGASHLDGASVLNLGFTSWDARSNVLANRSKLLAALEAEQMKLVALRQFHSDVIHLFDAAPEQAPRGDAAITCTTGLALGIQTADCLPILLVDPERRAVAAIHAGWRGTLQRITGKTLGRMQMNLGTHPESVIAVLGPGIGVCCYEVGPQVAEAYSHQFAAAGEWFEGPFDQLSTGEQPNPLRWLSAAPPGHETPPPRVRLDLMAANRWQLLDAGVNPSNIISSRLCTACRTDLLFSHRRERGRTGRMLAVIGLRPEAARDR